MLQKRELNTLKNVAFTSLVIIVLLLGCIETWPTDKNNNVSEDNESPKNRFLIHEDPVYKVKISYPQTWKLVSTEENIFAIQSPKESVSDTFQENLNLVMNDLSGQQLTLDAYKDLAIESIRQAIMDFSLIEFGPATLAKNPAYKIVFTGTADKHKLKFMQVFTAKNDISYVLTFAFEVDAFTEYLDTAQRMLDTFEITGDIIREPKDKPADEVMRRETPINDGRDAALVGLWRVYSERIFYDIGGGGALGIPVTRNLEIISDGTWKFGNSKGTWVISGIIEDDWKKWGIPPYGPKRKITLKGWNDAIADGPVEETERSVDFIWVIYHVMPPLVQNAGTAWLKFGHR